MEVWHLSYEQVMAMPTSRRHRMIARKIELERRREEKLKRK
jgi:hypothetical protein